LVDLPRDRVYLSDMLARMLGYDAATLAGTEVTQVFETADLDALSAVLQSSQHRSQPVPFSCRVVQADAQRRTLELQARLIPAGPDHAVILLESQGLLAQRLQEALDSSERRYRAMVAHSSDVMTVLGPDGYWIESSEAGSRLLGYPKGFDPDGGIFSLVHDEDLPRAVAALEEVVAGVRRPNQPVEFRVRAADGEWRTFESVGQDLTDDEDVRGVLVVSRDVTERKQAEQALADSEERFRVLAEAAAEGVCIAEQGQVVSANSAFSALYGYEPDEVIGLPVDVFVGPDQQREVLDNHASGRDTNGEFVGVRKDGSRFPVSATGRTVIYQGRPVRVVTIVDLSEQKRNTALEERRRIARDLHDGLAHELAFIAAKAHALLRQPPDATDIAQLGDAAERALDEARRAISVLSAGQAEPIGVALTQTAEDVAARHGIAVLLDLEPSVEVPAVTCENLLRIVREAITNAGRHGRATSISVRLWQDQGVHLLIGDDGSGFDPTVPATGFGLVSMQERAAALGAAFVLRTSPGAGTQIEVVIP